MQTICDTVDGSEILHQLRLVVSPNIICRVFTHPGGCLGFLPSTVTVFYASTVITKCFNSQLMQASGDPWVIPGCNPERVIFSPRKSV